MNSLAITENFLQSVNLGNPEMLAHLQKAYEAAAAEQVAKEITNAAKNNKKNLVVLDKERSKTSSLRSQRKQFSDIKNERIAADIELSTYFIFYYTEYKTILIFF